MLSDITKNFPSLSLKVMTFSLDTVATLHWSDVSALRIFDGLGRSDDEPISALIGGKKDFKRREDLEDFTSFNKETEAVK